MTKLNFGCGNTFSPNWVNIDVYSASPQVQRVNLLKRLPFPNDHFDAAYSSHVLEHFTPAEGSHLISEAFRVLKPRGILRTVVPDLEATCREYLRVLDSSAPASISKQYSWIILELLDQLTRSTPSGELDSYFRFLEESGDAELRDYVRSRCVSASNSSAVPKTFLANVYSLSPQKIYNKLFYIYLRIVSHAFPRQIRSQVMVLTGLGERHRWMYDRIGLSLLLQKHGFHNITIHRADTSSIPNFNDDGLDLEKDGTPRKRVSLYIEATKPGESQPIE